MWGTAQCRSQATSTVPIVFTTCNDDFVATGLIASLARPGGNITGLSDLAPALGAKRLELLKKVVPKAIDLRATRE